MSEISIVGGNWPLLEEREYTAKLLFHVTNSSAFRGKPKVYFVFRLAEPGYSNEKLFAAFNVKEIVGRPEKNGKFNLTRRQDLTLQLANLIPNFRLDRISLRPLVDRLFTISVRTVVKDYKQRHLPMVLQYSVVDQILSFADLPSFVP